MRYKFANDDLNAMSCAIGRCKRDAFTRNLYSKLMGAFYSLIRNMFPPLWRGVELNGEELKLIRKQLGKDDGTIAGWGNGAIRKLDFYISRLKD